MHLEITVVEIKGTSPLYRLGHRFVLRHGYILEPGAGGVCMHSLASILPYYVALSREIDPLDLGLAAKADGNAYVQCLDPCEITGGGTVRFRISPRRDLGPPDTGR